MQIHRVSLLSGKSHVMDLPVTVDQLNQFDHGMHVQNAFPHLTPDQREFILSGITPEEWDEMKLDEDE